MTPPLTLYPLYLAFITRAHHSAELYVASNPHGLVVFMCDTGAGKSCTYAAAFLLYSGIVLSSEEACAMVSKERSSAARCVTNGQPLCRAITYSEHITCMLISFTLRIHTCIRTHLHTYSRTYIFIHPCTPMYTLAAVLTRRTRSMLVPWRQ